MEDIPQPADTPYSPGDTVKIYIDPRDPDSQYHGITAEIMDVHVDDLDSQTGRDLDAYTYHLKDTVTGKELPLQFRHADLVPPD